MRKSVTKKLTPDEPKWMRKVQKENEVARSRAQFVHKYE